MSVQVMFQNLSDEKLYREPYAITTPIFIPFQKQQNEQNLQKNLIVSSSGFSEQSDEKLYREPYSKYKLSLLLLKNSLF